MAIPVDRVTARYKELFGSVGLPKTRLNAIAAKLAERFEEDATDEDIDNELNAQNEIYPFSEIKKAEDRAVSERNRKPKPAEQTPKEETKEEVDETPKWAQSLIERLDKMEKSKAEESIAARFKSDKRLEGIPASMLKGRIPKDEDSFEESIEELVSDWAEISGIVAKEEEKTKLGQFSKGIPAAGSAGKKAQQVSEAEADEITKQLV